MIITRNSSAITHLLANVMSRLLDTRYLCRIRLANGNIAALVAADRQTDAASFLFDLLRSECILHSQRRKEGCRLDFISWLDWGLERRHCWFCLKSWGRSFTVALLRGKIVWKTPLTSNFEAMDEFMGFRVGKGRSPPPFSRHCAYVVLRPPSPTWVGGFKL